MKSRRAVEVEVGIYAGFQVFHCFVTFKVMLTGALACFLRKKNGNSRINKKRFPIVCGFTPLESYPLDIYTRRVYNNIMIKSFADKETELIYNQKFSTRLPNTIQKVALRKLIMIDNAKCLEDLRVPPNNHLEQLVGNRKGQHSIRINDQWRVCFTEKDGHYYDVEIVDYH